MQQQHAHAQNSVQTAPPSRRPLDRRGLAPSRGLSTIAVSFSLLLAAGAIPAQTTASQAPESVETKPAIAPVQTTVTVTASQDTLKETETTGSRLGLTPLETPASVLTIGEQAIATRGYEQVEEAVRSMPGVSSGGSPADPSQFVARGFTGNQVTLLRDGIYVGPANMVTRAENSFNLQSVELLQGPGSVLYGQGSVGGTVNVVTKAPAIEPRSFNAYSSYGTFNTYDLGIGAGGEMAKALAFRSDFSYYASDGYYEHSNPYNMNGTGSLLWSARKNISFRLSLDVLKDKLPSAYGTPFVSAAFGTHPIAGVLQTSDGTVLDARMRHKNYNVSDAQLDSSSYQPGLTINWQPTANLSIVSQTYYYHAARNWMNAEQYIFIAAGATDGNGGIAPTNEIERDRFQVHHNQQLPGNSQNITYAHKVFGLNNKISGGYEFYNISFSRARGFNWANNYADFVDALNPVQGYYAIPVDPGDNAKRVAPTKITDNAGNLEDALNFTSKLILVTGIRFENFYLDRLNFNANGSANLGQDFSGNYQPVNFRVGAVYSLTPSLTAYGQFATAKDPPGNNIFLVNKTTPPFKLSSSQQGEVGMKAVFPKGFGESTLALYEISRDNILTATQTSASTDNGQQKSKGVEFSTILHPSRLVDVNFNTAYTHARFGFFSDPNTGDIDTGKIPADIPATTSNLWADVRKLGSLPLEVGGGWRFVGGRYADNANQTKLYNYSLIDAYGSYRFTEKLTLTARGKNLFDKAHAQWADINYPTEIVLGSPRTFMVSFNGRF